MQTRPHMKQEASLRNWHFEWLPYERCNIAIGDVYGHPNFSDGYRIHTSKIIDFSKRYGVIQTLHTFYQLEDYEYYDPTEESELEGQASEGSRDVPADIIPLRQRKSLGR